MSIKADVREMKAEQPDDHRFDGHELLDALRALFVNRPPSERIAAVLARRQNSWSSTFDSEVVTCRLVNGLELNVLCKYEQFRLPQTSDHRAWGHRRGDGYEADVYRRVLERMGAVAPRHFGMHRNSRSGATCMFLEYLDGAQHPEDATGLHQAATWLAHFHRDAEPFASTAEATFLIRYDRYYYDGWARRTAEFAQPLHDRYPWVRGVCQRFADHAASTLESQPTVIHGECYRKNVLMHQGNVCAIDWESCAVGAGEVDVAMLGEGWPKDVANEIEGRYLRERWPDGTSKSFAQRVAMAKVYVQLRWLGEEPRRTLTSCDFYFDALRHASERAGLLS